ncbi:MAG TPA: DUF58 domain-containing protein [Gaiellaceae bacterium]|nr:DUF58 domain-containing protein [Gaiellaceae bacterium]
MRRWGGAFALGIGVTAAALAFGSRSLEVVGLGLLVAAGATRAWAGLVRGPVTVTYVVEPPPATEGDRVRLTIEARRESRVPVGSFVARGVLGRLGEHECRLRGHRRVARGELDLGELPRGRFPLSERRLVLGDFLGLETVGVPLSADGIAVVVHPRLVALEALFSDAGRLGGEGRRLLLRRPAGFDFHSVREYEQGESLRRVHWPTSARRGQLMVKQLEDAPRDNVVVLLDCDPAGAAGEPPDSSFDAAVRAAGSILLAHASRGRTAALVTTRSEGDAIHLRSAETDLDAALGALAAAEPDASHGLARCLGLEQSPVVRAGELVVVTATLEPAAVAALLGTAARRLVSVAWIDAPSFASRPTRANPGVLRLSAAGIPVAVVRRGDDLATVLGGRRTEAFAHG